MAFLVKALFRWNKCSKDADISILSNFLEIFFNFFSRYLKTLEQKVKELECLISTEAEECILQEYNKCKQDLEEISNYITEGIILRSKTDWYELGEKSTKYFLDLEKRNKARSHIRTILNESSSEITDSKAILSELKSFYSYLYEQRSTKTKADCLHYISNFSVPKLSEEDRTICEDKLSKKECYEPYFHWVTTKAQEMMGFLRSLMFVFSMKFTPS